MCLCVSALMDMGLVQIIIPGMEMATTLGCASTPELFHLRDYCPWVVIRAIGEKLNPILSCPIVIKWMLVI